MYKRKVITILLAGIILICSACNGGGSGISESDTEIEGVEDFSMPKSGWVTALWYYHAAQY